MSYYSVKMDGVEIFDPSHKETNLLAPRVTMAAGEAGSFEFTFPANGLFKDKLIPYGSTIEVFEDDESVFYGRPVAPTTDIYGQKTIHCEGALAFLNDVICPPDAPGLSATMTDGEFYTFLINYYNSQQTRSDRKLTIGTAPTGGTSRVHEWSFQSCLDELKSDVLPYTGGIILTHRVDGETVIDWINEYTDSGNQPIKLGLNLLDLSATGAEIYTSAIAKGAQDDNGDDIRMSAPVKLSADIVRKYGDICVYLEYPTITTVAELRAKCVEFLYSQVFKDLKFDISAVDIHALESEAFERFDVGMLINVEIPSTQEIFNLPITKIEINLEKGTKNITVTSPVWAEQKMYIRSKYNTGLSTRVNTLNTVDVSIPHITTNNLDYLYLRNPETGKLQAIQISGTNITAIELPEISLGDIDLNIGDILDFDLIDVSVDGVDMSLNDFLSTYPNMTTNLADGYQLTGNDSVLAISGNIAGYPYSDSVDTGIEEPYITDYYIKADTTIIYSVGDTFDLSNYHAIFEYSDGTEVDVTDESEFNIQDGFVFETRKQDKLTAIHPDYSEPASLVLLFDEYNANKVTIVLQASPISVNGFTGITGLATYKIIMEGVDLTTHYGSVNTSYSSYGNYDKLVGEMLCFDRDWHRSEGYQPNIKCEYSANAHATRESDGAVFNCSASGTITSNSLDDFYDAYYDGIAEQFGHSNYLAPLFNPDFQIVMIQNLREQIGMTRYGYGSNYPYLPIGIKTITRGGTFGPAVSKWRLTDFVVEYVGDD